MADKTDKTAEEIAEARREALLETIKQMNTSPNALATSAKVDAGTLRGVANARRGMGLKSWQKVAAVCPAGSPLREMFKDDLPGEAPAAAPAAAPTTTGQSDLRMIPLNRLKPGPNYRKTFNEESIAELADSILQHGLRQNLTTYPEDPEDGCFPIDSGERRFRAMSLLVKRGDWAADRPVQCLVSDMAPDMGLALSIIENLQREDVPAAEEAEAFIRLRDSFNWSASDIAEKIGGKNRKGYVLQRMNLLEKLVPDGLKLYVADKITFEQARALWSLPGKVQRVLIDSDYDLAPGRYRDNAARMFPSLKAAIFDRSEYDGEMFSHEKTEYFADIDQFERLQKAAIETKLEALKAKWSHAEIVKGHFNQYDYAKTRDRKKGFAVIEVGESSSYYPVQYTTAEIYEGYCKKSAANSSSVPGEAPKPQGLSKAQLETASHLKTMELQRAIAEAENGPKIAMAATVVSLFPEGYYTQDVKLRAGDFNASDMRKWMSPMRERLAQLMQPFADDGLVEIVRDDRNRPEIETCDEAGLFNALLASPALPSIFAAAVAFHCGTFHGHTPSYGDSPLALAMAEAAGADLQGTWRMTPDYLKAFKRGQLEGVAGSCLKESWEGDINDMPQKKGDAMTWIETHLFRDPEWLAPEMHFGPAHEIAGRIGSMLGVDLPEAKEPEPEPEEDEDGEDGFDPETDEMSAEDAA